MTFLDQSSEIERVLTRALEEENIALDTEFVWTKTFYPIPGLLQIKSAGEIHLIDLLIEDFPTAILKQVLEDKSVCKILHSPDQDLKLFKLFCGAEAKNIFDTQLAYAFTGALKQVSLAKLCAHLVDVEISKTQQVSDWTKRPLTESQLIYAAEDVRYLIEIADILRNQLKDLNRYDWFIEENQVCTENPAIYEETTAELAYKRVKQFGRLPIRSLVYLQKMAAYRHELAHKRNITPNFIFHQNLLFKAALHTSSDHGQFIRNGFNERQLEKHYKNLQAIAKSVQAIKDEDLPRNMLAKEPSASEKALIKECASAMDKVAEQHDLDPGLIYARNHIKKIILKAEKNPLNLNIHGWRKEVLGDTFEKIINK
ncbi:ribonuclease D [Lentisphaera profundi]|uniref:Ribonuclease D n=1 Tax=Lentisphaera profundi TaxID=1658616 RepID=A0ABY7VY22_9BACT|nr:ribonuclease D [Lentisphaera profundi]WDE99171.1 ribonuclease D [Lentisphaera profundi]